MKPTIFLAAACVCLSSLAAQDEALQTARAEYKAMKAAYDAATDAYYAARNAGEKPTAPDKSAWAVKFSEASDRYAPGPGEVPFLGWVVLWSGEAELANSAIETILERHPGSEDLLEIAENLGWVKRQIKEENSDRLMAVLLESESALVRANALFSKGSGLMRPRTRGGVVSDEDRAAGQAMLDECARLAEGTTLALRAGAAEFERTRLQIGMESPDIVGADLDGVEFKLSDYRGKVVVIDFWGDW